MSSGTTQVDKLQIQVEGRESLRDATRALEQQRDTIRQLTAAYKDGKLGSQQYAEQLRQEVTVLRSLQTQVSSLGQSLGGASSGMKTHGVNQLSYAVQDFISTSGGFAQKLNSVTNNLQVFAASLGVGGAWFLGITAAIGAVQLLANNADKIGDYLKGVDPAAAEAAKKRFDDAKKKAEDVAKSIEKLAQKESENPQAKEAGDIFSASVAESGGVKKVQTQLASQYNRESAQAQGAQNDLQQAAAEKEAADKAVANIGIVASNEPAWKIRRRQSQAAKKLADAQARVAAVGQEMNTRAGETISKASQGDQSSIQEVAKRFPYTSIPSATADAMAQQEADDTAFLATTETTPEGRAARQERARRAQQAERNDAARNLAATNAAYAQRAQNQKDAEKDDKEQDRINQRISRDQDRRNGPLPPDPSIAERKRYADEFAQRSANEGYNFNPQQVEAAARAIQQSVNQGGNLGQAMQQAFMTLASNVNAIQAQQASQAQWWQRAGQQQQSTRTRLPRGAF